MAARPARDQGGDLRLINREGGGVVVARLSLPVVDASGSPGQGMAMAEGVRRVVVIGAGFDTLALRLAPSFPAVTWVEVDHPATQGQKRRGLSNCQIATPANLHYIGADLARDSHWTQHIGANDQPTLVIAEGLLMYLAPDRVQSLLRDQLPSLAPGGLRVIFSYMVRWPTGRGGFRPASRLVEAWLRRQHEPFTWMMAPAAAPQWLGAMNYQIVEHRQPPYLDPGLSSVVPAGLQGENLIEAVRVRHESPSGRISMAAICGTGH